MQNAMVILFDILALHKAFLRKPLTRRINTFVKEDCIDPSTASPKSECLRSNVRQIGIGHQSFEILSPFQYVPWQLCYCVTNSFGIYIETLSKFHSFNGVDEYLIYLAPDDRDFGCRMMTGKIGLSN